MQHSLDHPALHIENHFAFIALEQFTTSIVLVRKRRSSSSLSELAILFHFTPIVADQFVEIEAID